MSEELSKIKGQSVGAYGSEKTVFEHKTNPGLLVKVDHETRSSQQLEIERATTNIFYSIFPRNFTKTFRAKIDPAEDKSFTVVRKVFAPTEGFGPRYKEAKASFLKQIGSIIKASALPHLVEYFDFNGDLPNLLIDGDGNPVYVDMINPRILEVIDAELLKKVVQDPRKQAVLLKMIEDTIQLNRQWQARARLIGELLSY